MTDATSEMIRLSELLKDCAAWQKRAVKEMKSVKVFLNLLNYKPNTLITERIDSLTQLIKEASK